MEFRGVAADVVDDGGVAEAGFEEADSHEPGDFCREVDAVDEDLLRGPPRWEGTAFRRLCHVPFQELFFRDTGYPA